MGCSCTKGGSSSSSACTVVPAAGGGAGGKQDIRDHYKIGYLLGSGAFGQVRECRRRADNAVYAVKIMERRGRESGHWSNEAMFRREVQLLGLLTHSNIVKYLDFYEDQHFLYAVIERCQGGELFDQIIRCKRFRERDASYLCRQMLQAVQYCHRLGIVHRDIKAENFLFKTADLASDLKLIDFGMSARLSGKTQILSEVCGSPHYLSPELVRRKYNTKADMWALGVLIYLMLFGRYPFESSNTDAIVRQILTSAIDWRPANVVVSDEALSFMQALLERDPKKRLSADDALEHPWVKNCDTPEAWRRRKAEEKEQQKAAAAAAKPLAPKPPNPPSSAGSSDLLAQVKRAHRRVSRNRGAGTSRLDSRRNLLLKRLERDWLHGKTTGVRVVPAPRRPEFVPRRDVKHNTTPGRFPANNLADLQALRRHIECNCKPDAELLATPATTPPPEEPDECHDWDAAEESLRRIASDEALPVPRRALSVAQMA